MIDGHPLQFDFVDSKETDDRNDIEDQKIKFLNDIMDLFFDIQRYVTLNEVIEDDYYDEMDCMTELDKKRQIEIENTPNNLDNVMNTFDEMEL